jgi:DNA-binding LacI/PurR family transcriptional regulator
MVEADDNQGMRAVTMEMIAQRCGVHRSTVQRALTGGPARGTTAARIRQMAAEMGYDPHAYGAAARLVSLRQGRRVINRIIALYLPSIFARHTYYLRLLHGILEASVETGFEVLVAYYDMDRDIALRAPLPRSVVSGSVDAVITASDPDDFTQRLEELRATPHFGDRPVITLFEPMPDTYSVLIDDYAGARAACEHLLDLGHRHLLYLASSRSVYSYERRVAGWQDALAQRGLSPAAYLHHTIVKWSDASYEERFADAVLEGLTTHPEITAILLPNDTFAPMVHALIQSLGKDVPRDISLMGFDDTDPLLDAEGRNILTSLHLPLEEVGRIATRLAVQHISGEGNLPSSVILPVSLVPRQSAAHPTSTCETVPIGFFPTNR